MKKVFGLVVAFMVVFSVSIYAQEVKLGAVGARGGIGFGSVFGIVGGHADIVFKENLRFQPDLLVLFTSDDTQVVIDFNVNYLLDESDSGMTPYFGAGLAVATGNGTDVGLNLLGGVEKNMSDKYKVFAEARGVISEGNFFLIMAGISFLIN